jgi:hypothetical protein
MEAGSIRRALRRSRSGYPRLDMSAPPNNPLKLPFFIACAAIGLFVAVIGALFGVWWLVVFGLAIMVVSGALARVVRHGDNPRWLQSPLDRRWPRRPD